MPAELRWTPGQIRERLDQKAEARAARPAWKTGAWITITVEPTRPVKAGIQTIKVGWFGYCDVAIESADGTLDVWVRENDLWQYLKDYVHGRERQLDLRDMR
jgi:hypothetical protein